MRHAWILLSMMILMGCRTAGPDSSKVLDDTLDTSGNCTLVCEGRDLDTVSNIASRSCTSENARNIFSSIPRCPYSVRFSAAAGSGSGTCNLVCEGEVLNTTTTTAARCVSANAYDLFDSVPRCPYELQFVAASGSGTCNLVCEGEVLNSTSTTVDRCVSANAYELFDSVPRCPYELQFVAGGGSGSNSVSGTYQNYGFRVEVSGNRATLSWDDGTRGFSAVLNPNPNPRPRCPCDVFDGPDGRRITVERGQGGRYTGVTYSRNGR